MKVNVITMLLINKIKFVELIESSTDDFSVDPQQAHLKDMQRREFLK